MNCPEWDFAYLDGLPQTYRDAAQRAAVLYEYATHNNSLIEWIRILRREEAFSGQPVRREILNRVTKERGFLNVVELLFLAGAQTFPDFPFRIALDSLDPAFFMGISAGNIVKRKSWIQEVPWENWSSFSRLAYEGDPVERIQLQHRAATSAHVFAVNWDRTTNEELAKHFKTWASKNRPSQYPERKGGGRGTGNAGLASDRLNQLSAYRFDAAGYTWKQAREVGFVIYNGSKRWKTAIMAAKSNIDSLYPPAAV